MKNILKNRYGSKFNCTSLDKTSGREALPGLNTKQLPLHTHVYTNTIWRFPGFDLDTRKFTVNSLRPRIQRNRQIKKRNSVTQSHPLCLPDVV